MANPNPSLRPKASELLARYQQGERAFPGADLRKADLRGASLSGVNLHGADLRGARLHKADLRSAKLTETLLGPTRSRRAGRQLVGLFLLLPLALLFVGTACLAPAWVLSRFDDFKLLRVAVLLLGVLAQVLLGLRLRTAVLILAVQLLVTVLAAPLPTADNEQGLMFVRFAVAGSVGSVLGLLVLALAPRSTLIGVGLAALGLGILTQDGSNQSNFTVLATLSIGLIVMALLGQWLRGRALSGSPRHAELRRLILWFDGRGAADLSEADLTGADLGGANLTGANFSGARLLHTGLTGAHGIRLARFSGTPLAQRSVQQLLVRSSEFLVERSALQKQDLSGLALRGAQLVGIDLEDAKLVDADLTDADLSGANLSGVDLRGATLTGTKLDGARLGGARIDLLTFLRSRWDGGTLAGLKTRGVEVLGLEAFPDSVKARLRGELEGLRLRLRGELRAQDRMALAGLVVGVLGPDSDCAFVVEPGPDPITVVTFRVSRAEDLAKLTAAVIRRAWEPSAAGASDAAWMLTDDVAAQAVRAGLSELLGQRLVPDAPATKAAAEPVTAVPGPATSGDAMPATQVETAPPSAMPLPAVFSGPVDIGPAAPRPQLVPAPSPGMSGEISGPVASVPRRGSGASLVTPVVTSTVSSAVTPVIAPPDIAAASDPSA